MQINEHINITNKTKCRISFCVIYLPIFFTLSLSFCLSAIRFIAKLVKCQTPFGNTVRIPVTILLQETSWTVASSPLPCANMIRTSSSLSLSFFLFACLARLLQFKKFPIGTACCIRFERKFFMGANDAKEKSVQTSLPDWPAAAAAVDRRRREIDNNNSK